MSSDADAQYIADKLQLTQLDAETHWEGYWDAAFAGQTE